MAYRNEVEVTITSAKDLKNVNWRYGPIRPYAVVWVDSNKKCSTRVDDQGDTCPHWDETLVIPLPGPVDGEKTLFIDIVHAGNEDDTKKLIGSAKLKLRDVINDVGLGERASFSLKLKRPSGRPHGKVDFKVAVREPRYERPGAYNAPPYGVPQSGSRDYNPAPPQYGYAYGQPPQPARDPYYATAPPSGYPSGGYNAPPATAPPSGYPSGGYNAPPAYGQQQSYGQPSYGGYGGAPPAGGSCGQVEEKKKSKFGGMGTGLAVGAVAGVLGGIALTEGFDALENKIADDAADKVEDDVGYDDDDYGGDDY